MTDAGTALLISAGIGLLTGSGIALSIVGKMLDRSNNKGDSKGECRDFAKIPLTVYERRERMRKPL